LKETRSTALTPAFLPSAKILTNDFTSITTAFPYV
jgi:hypothetical protein